jgi:hypothetical protein
VKHIKWRVNYNRPLSLEERQIAERLATDPAERVARTAQSWHSSLTGAKKEFSQDASILQEEEA